MPLRPLGRYVSFRRPATAGCEIAHSRATEKKVRSSSTRMICLTVEIREGALTYRVRVTASSIEYALKIPESSDQREA
jgi:hypothetical protein